MILKKEHFTWVMHCVWTLIITHYWKNYFQLFGLSKKCRVWLKSTIN